MTEWASEQYEKIQTYVMQRSVLYRGKRNCDSHADLLIQHVDALAARLAKAEELLHLTMRSPRAPYEKIADFLVAEGP